MKKMVFLICAISLHCAASAQIFPAPLLVELPNINLLNSGIKKIEQNKIIYIYADSVMSIEEKKSYIKQEFVLEFDSIGRLVAMKYGFLPKPPPVLIIDSLWRDRPKESNRITSSIGKGNCSQIKYTYNDSGVVSYTRYLGSNYFGSCTPENKFNESSYSNYMVIHKWDDNNNLISNLSST